MDIDDLRIRAGSSYSLKEGIVYRLERANVHPNYNSNNIDYDFAVLKVRQIPFFASTDFLDFYEKSNKNSHFESN